MEKITSPLSKAVARITLSEKSRTLRDIEEFVIDYYKEHEKYRISHFALRAHCLNRVFKSMTSEKPIF